MTELLTTPQAKELHRKFVEDVMGMPSGEKINICQQCGTCTGSCPTSYLMDFGPREVIAAFRAGMIDKVVQEQHHLALHVLLLLHRALPRRHQDHRPHVRAQAPGDQVRPRAEAEQEPGDDQVSSSTASTSTAATTRSSSWPGSCSPKDWSLPFKFWQLGLKLFTAGRMPLTAKNIRGKDELDKISAYLEAQEAKAQ